MVAALLLASCAPAQIFVQAWCKMTKLPKLKVQGFRSDVSEEIRDFEQAKLFPFSHHDLVVVVEGEVVNSYEDIVQIVAQERYKDKEYLEVAFVPMIEGG